MTVLNHVGLAGVGVGQAGTRTVLIPAVAGAAPLVGLSPGGLIPQAEGLLAQGGIVLVIDYETKEQVRECDVAHDLEITREETFGADFFDPRVGLY